MKPIWCCLPETPGVTYSCFDYNQASCIGCVFYVNQFKGNQYVDKYIEKVNAIRKEKQEMKEMSWENGQVTVSPTHRNNFQFQVRSGNAGSPGFLSVEDARKLGKWLLEVTEGIEHTYNIVEEINRRSNGND